MWEVGFGNGVRKIHSEFNEVPFFLLGKRIVVLHAFIKKSQQTPYNELKMARKRLKEVMYG